MTSAHESLRTILDAFHVLHRTPTCFSSSDPLDHESTIVCRGRLEALLAAGTVYDNARNTLVAFFTEFEQFVDDQLTDTSERILQRIGDRSHTMSTAMGTNGALIAHPDAGAVRVTAHSPDVDGQLELTCIADRLPLVCIAVAAGRHYSFFIDADGQLLCGGGRFGSPQLMQSLCGIQFVGVSTGWDWTTAVTLTGEVYTWYTMNVPILCGGGLTVLSVASGWRHCIAVAEGGGVYSWGKNESSQCGYESAGNGTPRRIELLSSIHAMNASAGCLHSLVVSDTGSVFAFGDNRFGQLGHVHQNHRGCQLPRLVQHGLAGVRVSSTAAGGRHSLALSVNGKVFSWGYNNHGQLGNCYQSDINVHGPLPYQCDLTRIKGYDTGPTAVTVLQSRHTSHIAAGAESSCAVVDGHLYTWGHTGLLGHGEREHLQRNSPERVDALRGEFVVAVSMGTTSTLSVSQDGRVFGWGDVRALGLLDNPHARFDDGSPMRSVTSPCTYKEICYVRALSM